MKKKDQIKTLAATLLDISEISQDAHNEINAIANLIQTELKHDCDKDIIADALNAITAISMNKSLLIESMATETVEYLQNNEG